jgi:hypothetical protein
MKKPRKLSLVKYDYDSNPKEWKEKNPNAYEDYVFCYLGDIPNMPGHSYCLDLKTGKGYPFHTEDIKELTEDET